MSEHKYRATPEPIEGMPPGIPYIVGNEAAERFSFYGMKAILAIFMTQHLLGASGQPDTMSDEAAKAWVHNFVSATYFFPIIGAVVSDWLFGKYRTILGLSLVYCAGHAVLALMDVPLGLGLGQRTFLWWGLALVAVGSGGIKPCVSAHVGDQFGQRNKDLLPRIFAWFYFSINLGAFFSTLLTPILLDRFGPGWAFGVPGILMGLATLVFWLGRNKFVHIPPAGNALFRETFSPDGVRAILNLIPLYVFIAMFWALFDQTASAWVLQATHMDLSMPGPTWWLAITDTIGLTTHGKVLPSQVQAVNPIFVLTMIPVFSYGVYPLLGRLFEVTPLRKIGAGLFLTVLAFAIPGWIELRIAAGQTPHIGWQILAYFVLTAAEIMVSITALEFSYTQAPKKMKSFIMGLYLLSVALGNQFTARVNEYIGAQKERGVTLLEGANYYWFFTAAMAATAVLYVVWSQFYQGETYIQEEEEPAPQDDRSLSEDAAESAYRPNEDEGDR